MTSPRVPGSVNVDKYALGAIERKIDKIQAAYQRVVDACSDIVAKLREKTNDYELLRNNNLVADFSVGYGCGERSLGNALNRDGRVPWISSPDSDAFSNTQFLPGAFRRTSFPTRQRCDRSESENHETRMRAVATQIKDLTFDLFSRLALEIDRSFNGESLKNKYVVITRGVRGSCARYEKHVVELDDVSLVIENEPDWPLVQNGSVELVNVVFDEDTRATNVTDLPLDVYNSDSDSSARGSLKLHFSGAEVFRIATDATWRAPVPLHCDETLGNVARGHSAGLSNRLQFLFRYVLHSFTHVMAALHPDVKNAMYTHERNPFYDEIREYYEPRGVLR